MNDSPTLRALAAYKPILPLANYPVLVVSTAFRESDSKYTTEVVFVRAGNVDGAMFELVRKGAGSSVVSEWLVYREHPDIKDALEFMTKVNRAFHTKELQVVQGNTVYMAVYDKLCPEDFRATPGSTGPDRSA